MSHPTKAISVWEPNSTKMGSHNQAPYNQYDLSQYCSPYIYKSNKNAYQRRVVYSYPTSWQHTKNANKKMTVSTEEPPSSRAQSRACANHANKYTQYLE